MFHRLDFNFFFFVCQHVSTSVYIRIHSFIVSYTVYLYHNIVWHKQDSIQFSTYKHNNKAHKIQPFPYSFGKKKSHKKLFQFSLIIYFITKFLCSKYVSHPHNTKMLGNFSISYTPHKRNPQYNLWIPLHSERR